MKTFHRLCLVALMTVTLGCGKTTQEWADQAKDTDATQRLRAIHVLGTNTTEQERVLPVLIDALKDDNNYVRRDAARALAHFGPNAAPAVGALKERLRDPEPGVRKAVAYALAQITVK